MMPVRRRPILLSVVALAVWWSGAVRAARPDRQNPTVGQVIDKDSGQPLAGALVRATTLSRQPGELTAADGTFTLTDLPPHQVHVAASLPGYGTAEYGQRFPGDSALAWEPGDALVLRLERMSVIAGEVHDDAGAPVAGLLVVALRRTLVGGRWRYAEASTTMTSDEGAYRLTDLRPGRYFVAATTVTTAPSPDLEPPPEVAPGTFPHPTTFFPAGTSSAGASEITVGPGEAPEHVNINLQSSGCVAVAGTVTGPVGPVVLALDLVADSGVLPPVDLPTARVHTAADGGFRFACASAGAFRLRASAAGLWVDEPIVIGSDGLADLALAAQPDIQVTGKVTNPDTTPAAVKTPRQLVLAPENGRSLLTSGATIVPDGSFLFAAPPGRYVIFSPNQPIVSLKSAEADLPENQLDLGRAAVSGLAVTLGAGGSLSGDVQLAGGDWREASVYVFPQREASWAGYGSHPVGLVEGRLTRRGAYEIDDLPPGSYWVVASTTGPPDWRDPARLARLATFATAVELADGQNLSQNLTAVRVW